MPWSKAQVLAPYDVALRIADALYGGETEPSVDPHTFDLAGFQESAVRRARKILRAHGGVLIADSVGLGKTYIALALIEEELRCGGRVLVATPAALRRMWRTPLRRLSKANGVANVSGLGRGPSGPPVISDDDAADPRAPGDAALTWISHARLSRGVDASLVDCGADGSSMSCGAAAAPLRPAGGGKEGGPMSGGGWLSASRSRACATLVVVDEAHAFRNPRTRRYRELARITLNARVVLLTATPVNNTLLDLYSLIRLFAADTQFRDLGVEDLRAVFRAAPLEPDASPAPAMPSVVRAVMIRRTRPLLRESQNSSAQRREVRRGASAAAGAPVIQTSRPPDRDRVCFPERAPARVLRYDLEATVPNLLDDVAACLDALTFAPFRVHAYGPRGAKRQASGATELIRMMMLKRLESSVAALASSVDAQIAFVESFLEHLGGGRLLRPADHRASHNASDSAAVQLLLGGVALDPLPRRTDARALEADAAADLERLRALRTRVRRDTAPRDAKLGRLRELIDGELAGERVLVFTEFRETARYLWTALRDRGGIALIHGGGAFLGRSRCGRREVVERFSPIANGATTPPPREVVRVLIATDVLSEGMNLQDARHVVSYDLPWNPVRLIQRIGRIDRLGSTHDVVFTHTFIPQHGLDRLIGLLERIRIKLSAIHAGVGAETCLPRELAAPAFLDRLARGDPDILDEIERHDAVPFEAEERLRMAYLRVRPRPAAPAGMAAAPVIACCERRSDVGPPQPAPTTPPPTGAMPGRGLAGGARQPSDPATQPSVLIAVRVDGTVRLGLRTPSGQMLVDAPTAFGTLTALIEGSRTGPSTAPPIEPDRHEIARALRALRRSLKKRLHSDGRPPDSTHDRRRSAAHALSRRLLEALARAPGGPDARLCARAEKLLVMLARGGPAGLDHALASLHTAAASPIHAADLCDALETLLGSNPFGGPPTFSAESSNVGAIELIGAIELGVDAPRGSDESRDRAVRQRVRQPTRSSTDRHAPT